MKYLRLTAKVVIFSVCILWIFSFLGVSILVLPIFVDFLSEHYGLVDWGTLFLVVWSVFTVLAVGVLVANAGFKFIGRWERR